MTIRENSTLCRIGGGLGAPPPGWQGPRGDTYRSQDPQREAQRKQLPKAPTPSLLARAEGAAAARERAAAVKVAPITLTWKAGRAAGTAALAVRSTASTATHRRTGPPAAAGRLQATPGRAAQPRAQQQRARKNLR